MVGRLQSSSYTDSTGQKRTSIELVVLHSEPAPLPRKGDDATAEPAVEGPGSEEPLAEPEAPAEIADAPAPKPRRRRKVAA